MLLWHLQVLFAHFMCFEVPALVPPRGVASGNKTGLNDDDTNDDDLGILDIDENGRKTGNSFVNSPHRVQPCKSLLIPGYQIL
ncbi:Exocyst complex component SEC3A [Camellia lanceoleosa]|uniref:Exocyst complex component SEC3A n=1 Tax=Camellia lanceoleosa TaxID=1840588 RepID=A0ACC0HEZ1_9ERIC|nr:Exocyst complex component SEC3A [Camellia lanceoleosa]